MLMKKILNEGNEIHNFISSSGSGTIINYGSGSDFLTSYGSGYGSGSTSQKVTVPTVPVPVPVPQHCGWVRRGSEWCGAVKITCVSLIKSRYVQVSCRRASSPSQVIRPQFWKKNLNI